MRRRFNKVSQTYRCSLCGSSRSSSKSSWSSSNNEQIVVEFLIHSINNNLRKKLWILKLKPIQRILTKCQNTNIIKCHTKACSSQIKNTALFDKPQMQNILKHINYFSTNPLFSTKLWPLTITPKIYSDNMCPHLLDNKSMIDQWVESNF